ncbi:MAG TPA: MTH1187 family thiamine-binding protein [Terriglobales bacterium]|nr:MTH1187 family thiamine-binding protein [Terriglobales bacterium]
MLVQFTMFPLDKGESLSKYVAKVINLIDKSGLPYQTTSTCTLIEGEWDEVFRLIKECRNTLRKESNRIYTVIIVDDRKGTRNRLKGKVASVEKVLKRKISK